MAARLFLDEQSLRMNGFTEPNIRTLRELTNYLNTKRTVEAQQDFIGPLQDLEEAGVLVRVDTNEWVVRSIEGEAGHIAVTDGD
jgi:hypothetical protein